MVAGGPGLRADLERIVGPKGLVDAGDHPAYERGYRYGQGSAREIVRPASIDELRAIVRYCHAADLRMVVQGANTGLVAASTPGSAGDQLLISTTRLTGAPSISADDRSAVVMAGVRLSGLNAAAEACGLCFPIDLGADPSIGGMIATNTGGSRLIRYGDVRRNLLAVEAVIADADATVMGDLRGLRKDNSAADLKQLFVGTGGAFGIVTRAKVELHRLPTQVETALIVPPGRDAVPDLITALERLTGEFLSACEGISGTALETVLRHHPSMRRPVEPCDYAVLVELSTAARVDQLDLHGFLIASLAELSDGARPLVRDAAVGRGRELWGIRHAISESLSREGRVIAFDVSMPRGRLPEFHEATSFAISEAYPFLKVCDFGHCADGGDHFNVVWPGQPAEDEFQTVSGALRDFVYDEVVSRYGGSFSAEHGLGPYNDRYYRRYVPEGHRAMAAALKRFFDPKGLLGNFSFD